MRPVFDAIARASGLALPEAARVYAVAGVPVFPCLPGGKRPLTRRGFHDASADPEQIEAWWSRWPGANVGVPTGAVSGVEVVDVDVHEAGSGYGPFERAHKQGLVDGWGVLVRTPSGGLHAYYPADDTREHSSWQVPAEHVDFRGTGGYIIAPPSLMAVGAERVAGYELVVTATGTPAPVDAVRLRDFLDPRPASTPSPPGQVRDVSAERLAAWVAGRSEGERNRGLFWAACRLAENGTSPADTYAALVPAAEHAGLTSREVSATIRSAYRTTRGAPRTSADGLGEVTSRCVVDFLNTVRVSCCDYAAVSSGIATSSSVVSRSFMECSLK